MGNFEKREILGFANEYFINLEDEMNTNILCSPILIDEYSARFKMYYNNIINTPHLLYEFIKKPQELIENIEDNFEKEINHYMYIEYLVSVLFNIIIIENKKDINKYFMLNNNIDKYNYIYNLLLNGKK